MGKSTIDPQFIGVCKVADEKIKNLAEQIVNGKEEGTLDQITNYLLYRRAYLTICSEVKHPTEPSPPSAIPKEKSALFSGLSVYETEEMDGLMYLGENVELDDEGEIKRYQLNVDYYPKAEVDDSGKFGNLPKNVNLGEDIWGIRNIIAKYVLANDIRGLRIINNDRYQNINLS